MFNEELFTGANVQKQSKCPSMDEYGIYGVCTHTHTHTDTDTHNGLLSSRGKNEILPSVTP